ncbi:MAG: response regulator [Desulfobulbaceae bacterium]|nr:response regulator [Desulfobulbaceae bacterium]
MDEQKKKTILVVDDFADNIDVISDALSDEYRVRAAVNGEKALAVMASPPYPDLVLLDIMMPGLDGYEVCRRLKADARGKEIPVIFVTAMGADEDESKGFAVGAVDYITKPISPPILKARVRTHLELQEARHRLEKLVAARTEELRQANVRLGRQVKELSARDQLIRFQMQGPSLPEAFMEIGRVVEKVVEARRTVVFLADAAGELVAEVAVGSDRPDQPKLKPDLGAGAVWDMARKAFKEGRPLRDEEGRAAAPVIFNDERLGVISVEGVGGQDGYGSEELAVLGRLSREAALVLRSALVTDDLLNDKIDFGQLFHLGQ